MSMRRFRMILLRYRVRQLRQLGRNVLYEYGCGDPDPGRYHGCGREAWKFWCTIQGAIGHLERMIELEKEST